MLGRERETYNSPAHRCCPSSLRCGCCNADWKGCTGRSCSGTGPFHTMRGWWWWRRPSSNLTQCKREQSPVVKACADTPSPKSFQADVTKGSEKSRAVLFSASSQAPLGQLTQCKAQCFHRVTFPSWGVFIGFYSGSSYTSELPKHDFFTQQTLSVDLPTLGSWS